MRPDVVELVCLECMAHYHVAPPDAEWLVSCPVCQLELTEVELEEGEVRDMRRRVAA